MKQEEYAAEQIMFSPAAHRNRSPILASLESILPAQGKVLEIASGSGQHAVHFAAAMPTLLWQPTDRSNQALDSIRALLAQSRSLMPLSNVLEPCLLDVESEPWPVEHADVIYCANMIHIAPWTATLCLFDGASKVLSKGALLILYGPFLLNDMTLDSSNQSFDTTLREQNSLWGVRQLCAVKEAALEKGFQLESSKTMPASNLLLIFSKP
ncbi:MAG: DUF938 domain-containing protein [Granulosicoccus sp.]